MHPFTAITFNEAFHGHKEIGPYRLRTKIPTPDATRHSVHQKQNEGRKDQ